MSQTYPPLEPPAPALHMRNAICDNCIGGPLTDGGNAMWRLGNWKKGIVVVITGQSEGRLSVLLTFRGRGNGKREQGWGSSFSKVTKFLF